MEVSDDILIRGLRDLDGAHRDFAARYPGVSDAHVAPDRVLRIPHESLWTGEAEEVARDVARDLIALLPEVDPRDIGDNNFVLDRDFFAKYLYMNTVRVAAMCTEITRRIPSPGTAIEVGSYFGSFALALRRLGWQVTAVDRYDSYGPAFGPYTDLMEDEGVMVVRTTRETEDATLAGLATHDVVLAAAVIEHIPHTPRLFLEALRRKSTGLICLDTPNVARWWNRRLLDEGKSIFQDLRSQYFAGVPYEGHHREYTGPELAWMLAQVGCDEISVQYLDYNMLQFEELDSPHLNCLSSIIIDPAAADTVLACGHIAPEGAVAAGCGPPDGAGPGG